MYRLKILGLFLIVLFSSTALSAKWYIVDDPWVLYHYGNEIVSQKKARKIIIAAVDSNNNRRSQWQIVREQPGSALLRVGSNNIFADLLVKHGDNHFSITLKDSSGLRYREKGGKKYIHPRFKKWIKILLDNLRTAARNNQFNLVQVASLDQAKKSKRKSEGTAGRLVFVGSVTSLIDSRKDRSEKSKQYSDIIASTINKISSGSYTAFVSEKENYGMKVAAKTGNRNWALQVCNEYNASNIITTKVVREDYDEDDIGVARVAFKIYNYDCADESYSRRGFANNISYKDDEDYDNKVSERLSEVVKEFYSITGM